MKFRQLNKEELGILRGVNREFGADADSIFKGKKLLVALGGRKEVFVTNGDALDVLEKMKNEPYSVGLFIGEIKKKKFMLSLEGAALISKHAKNKIFVGSKTEQLVLYGRDVFCNSILKSSELSEGSKCLIVNESDELIAIGRVKKEIVENLIDRGWYLRKGE
ncbi:MAG: hypothetical protein QME59_07405 [Candidatus Hydrothermarchaeota archaeon]|nr:hypothetical protein [Candidatus Hydrothermarchaeota archaeon]